MSNSDDRVSTANETSQERPLALQVYSERCSAAWHALFQAAQSKDELQFAFALSPEFRGTSDAGWNAADESLKAVGDYIEILNKIEGRAKIRVALALYANMAEASGLYEIPKNMMLIISGENYNTAPFNNLIKKYTQKGDAISPNSNKIMKDLIGHLAEIDFLPIIELINESFDNELRNGYAHADYVIWNDGIRLPKKNGGTRTIISFDEFSQKLNRAMIFFETLSDVRINYIENYKQPKEIFGHITKEGSLVDVVISYNDTRKTMSVQITTR